MNAAQRRQALLDILNRHEEMVELLNCLGRSPAIWSDDDADGAVQMQLLAKGLLSIEGGFFATTEAGREALVNYINGTDEGE